MCRRLEIIFLEFCFYSFLKFLKIFQLSQINFFQARLKTLQKFIQSFLELCLKYLKIALIHQQ